ncbi:MAG: glycosyltransferase [Quinella sp. 1Q5]|nr:glycosyltransferase [Quinella sp. 1Q5]
MPKVSVILTSYNHAAFVAAAIDSVLKQTFTDFELLIVDDGSQDNSHDIIKAFDDSRIKTFLYDENRGPVLAVSEAIESARGKYIAVHHSDDLWTPDKLEKQVAFLDSNEDFAACFTWVEFVDEQGKTHELDADDYYKNIFDQPNRTRAEWLHYFFYNANCLCHPSVMLRRESVKKFHLLDTHGLWQLPDYLMWIRLCFHAEIFILPERLTRFRLRRTRQENTSATTRDRLIRADLENFFIAREFVDSFPDDKFFLEVFPEAATFLIDGKINRRFALAKLCLAKEIPAWQLVGLELIKNLLNTLDAAQIKNLYGYDEKTFLHDGGSFDVFNLTQKLGMLHTELFINDDYTSTKVAEKIISVDTSRRFYARFDLDAQDPIKVLRFDPDENFISVKIIRTLINGEPYEVSDSNANEVLDGFHRFWTIDPQFLFNVGNLIGHVTFEVFGEREEGFSDTLDKSIKALIERNEELKRQSLKSPPKPQEPQASVAFKEKALAAVRLLYKTLPIDEQRKAQLKDKFYTTFAPLLKNTHRYKVWKLSQTWQLKPPVVHSYGIYSETFSGELLTQPGRIAIQAHIFYLDLLDDMAAYCANMPYKFDALISIVEATAEDKIRDAFKKIPNAEKVFVRVLPNRGRDVAPFLVGFADLLPAYDFALHIHSKKSLHTGSEQQSWRNYLFDTLLGSPEHIRQIFKAFVDDKSVGVIYPRPADNVFYASFTWLSNRDAGQKLLSRADIPPNKTDYFDFPAGTMFWARTKALRNFFTIGLTLEDFPAEQAQNDGTIAHAFERSILLAAKAQGMNCYELDPKTFTYSINCGSKNLWQYYGRDEEEFKERIIPCNEIISFDLFDTLLMRGVAKDYHVRELVGLKVEALLGRKVDFPTLRAKVEIGDDITLDEVYKRFSELSGLDEATCKRIRELEVSTEVSLALPRARVVDWLKGAVKAGKEVWIICDTCLQTPDVERLLSKCGVEGYDKLLLSCETGLRKDTATLWNQLKERADEFTHIGDDEVSDIQLPSERGLGTYHTMSALNLFSQVPFGRNLLERLDYELSLYAGICLGVALAKKFHDPFRLSNRLTEESGRLILHTWREVGYWFCGVPSLNHSGELEPYLEELTMKLPMRCDLRELRAGAEEFCRDVKEMFGDVLARVPVDEAFVEAWIASFISDDKIVSVK